MLNQSNAEFLRQLRRICQSLDVESVKTLVRAFVASRFDYCNSGLFASAVQHQRVTPPYRAARAISALIVRAPGCQKLQMTA